MQGAPHPEQDGGQDRQEVKHASHYLWHASLQHMYCELVGMQGALILSRMTDRIDRRSNMLLTTCGMLLFNRGTVASGDAGRPHPGQDGGQDRQEIQHAPHYLWHASLQHRLCGLNPSSWAGWRTG